jgi:phosphoglycerol transferase MdoB-like AlkP superfamily enzyme
LSKKKRTIEEEGHTIILFFFFFFFFFFSLMPFTMGLILLLVLSNDICSLSIDELKENKEKKLPLVPVYSFVL